MSIKRYAEIKAEIKQKEQEFKDTMSHYLDEIGFDSIEARALEEMLANRDKTIPTEYGNVTVRETKKYDYPDWWVQADKGHKDEKAELEKKLLKEGKYSIEPSLQLAGKPKPTLIDKPSNPKGTIH